MQSPTSFDKQRLTLIRGRDFANQLLSMLRNHEHTSEFSFSSAEELAVGVLKCFSDCLSEIPATAQEGSVIMASPGDESKKAEATRRGCYQRRKNEDSWSAISANLEDGYAWRKYGQKDIQNAKHPRCYFRCTRRNDQGCRATKQVQMMENDSNEYHITYFGHHTCTNIQKPTHIFSNGEGLNPCILSPELNDFPNDVQHPLWPNTDRPGPSLFAVKDEEECKAHNDLFESENASSAEPAMWKDILASESHFEPTMNFYDYEDLAYDFQGLDWVGSYED